MITVFLGTYAVSYHTMTKNAVIVETESGSLPDHWTCVGRLDDGRRVMGEYESEEKAAQHIEKMYGMYRNDAEVQAIEGLTY